MVKITRREFLGSAAAAGICSQMNFAKGKKLRIGAPDWSLNMSTNPEAVPLAAKLGLDGVQVAFGGKIVDDKMPGDNPDLIARYLSLSKQYKMPLDGTCCDRLHRDNLKTGPQGPGHKWVLDSIRLTNALHTKVLLLPFFGHNMPVGKDEMDAYGDILGELGAEAAKAGVILGLENTLSAEDNVRLMERSKSANVQVYYDVGNSSGAGFDPVKEIRWLGKDRICQFHLKDGSHYLGEGKIQFAPILQSIHDIGFSGYANLETSAPSKDIAADMSKNLAYIRNLMAQA